MSMPVPHIAFLDSGTGGLHVLLETRLIFPQAKYLYVFDNEFFPYGDKDPNVIIRRVIQLVDHVLARCPVDLFVVACNTATTLAIEHLRKRHAISFVGIVPPIKTAGSSLSRSIAIIATPLTIASPYLDRLIRLFAWSKDVTKIASKNLAFFAEQKLSGVPVSLTQICQEFSSYPRNFDAVVLGCTHYSWLKLEIEACFKQSTVFDSTKGVVNQIEHILRAKNFSTSSQKNKNRDRVLVTFFNERDRKIFERYQLIVENYYCIL